MSPLEGVDGGLLERFRSAGARIAWREVPTTVGRSRRPKGPPPRSRIAHLHDEEARVIESASGRLVESGPVGALVLLLEIDRRGAPVCLRAHAAGEKPGFASGAIEARWDLGATTSAGGTDLLLRDLVDLARYALA